MTTLRIVCLQLPSGFLPPETVPLWNCTLYMHSRLVFNHLRRSLRRWMEVFSAQFPSLQNSASQTETILPPATHPQFQSLFPQLSEATWLYLGSLSLHWDLKTASTQKAGPSQGSRSQFCTTYCSIFENSSSTYFVHFASCLYWRVNSECYCLIVKGKSHDSSHCF